MIIALLWLSILTVITPMTAAENPPYCFRNDDMRCCEQRMRCIQSVPFEIMCLGVSKIGIQPDGPASPCTICQTQWAPTNIPCDTPGNIICSIFIWSTTVCALGAITQGILALSPCITKTRYNNIRQRICCCCPTDCYCCPIVDEEPADAALQH